MMAEVGIHVEHIFIAVLDGISHPGDDGRSQAELPGAMQAAQSRIGGRLSIAPLAGAIRRIVVDHQ